MYSHTKVPKNIYTYTGGDFISRQRRIWYPGAKYHVMNRGNRRTIIFQEDEDYQFFLYLLEKTQVLYPFLLISYCLMTNHIHLQIQTIDDSLSKIMHYLLSLYAKYYNTKYNHVGHLFQGRYKAELIEDDAYMLQTSRYIHLNPLKAKMVEKPEDYPWSSYIIFLGEENYDLVSDNIILDFFSDNKRQSYKEYVENQLFVEEISDAVLDFEEKVL